MSSAGVGLQALGESKEARPNRASPFRLAGDAGDAHTLSEEGLVRRAQNYDQEALGQIYETFYPKLYSYAYMQLADISAAEDMASAVLLQVLQAIPRYSFRGVPFSAWVFRIARNQLIDHHRRRRRRPVVELQDDVASDKPSPEEEAVRSLDQERLRRALAELGEDQRQVVVLKFLQGLDNQAIGRVMGRSEAAVKSLQHRALVALRRLLPRGEDDVG